MWETNKQSGETKSKELESLEVHTGCCVDTCDVRYGSVRERRKNEVICMKVSFQ